MDLGSILAGLFSIGVGLVKVKRGLKHSEDKTDEETDEDRQTSPLRRRRAQLLTGNTGNGHGKMKVEFHRVSSLDDRIRHITKMLKKGAVSPEVRKITTQILTRRCGDDYCVPEKDWKAEVVAIFTTLRQRYYRYVRDTYGYDLYQHPKRTLEFGGGDCDDASSLLGAMLRSVGYPVRLRVIQTKDAPDWNHIYVLVLLPPSGGPGAKWWPLDLSMNKPPGWEAPREIVKRVKDYAVSV